MYDNSKHIENWTARNKTKRSCCDFCFSNYLSRFGKIEMFSENQIGLNINLSYY